MPLAAVMSSIVLSEKGVLAGACVLFVPMLACSPSGCSMQTELLAYPSLNPPFGLCCEDAAASVHRSF